MDAGPLEHRRPLACAARRAADPLGRAALAGPEPARTRAARGRRAPRQARGRRRPPRGEDGVPRDPARRGRRAGRRRGLDPGPTQDAICAALVARGIEVHARHGACARTSRRPARGRGHAARDRRRRRLRADRADRRAPAGGRRGARRRDRGDDDRCRPPARHGRGRTAHVPRDRGQRRASASTSSTTAMAPASRRSRRSTG